MKTNEKLCLIVITQPPIDADYHPMCHNFQGQWHNMT